MRIFDFKCNKCLKEVEVFMSSDSEPTRCEECDIELEKIFSPTKMFILKGDGFYKPGTSL